MNCYLEVEVRVCVFQWCIAIPELPIVTLEKALQCSGGMHQWNTASGYDGTDQAVNGCVLLEMISERSREIALSRNLDWCANEFFEKLLNEPKSSLI